MSDCLEGCQPSMATNNARDPPTKVLGLESPLLLIPGEIRNKIYRHLLVSPSQILLMNTDSGPQAYHDEGPQLLSIHPALLGTCSKIYHEAITILYEENSFSYAHCLPPMEDSDPREIFAFGFTNFKRVRHLSVHLHLCQKCPLLLDLHVFMQDLTKAGCSFKELTLRYDLEGNDEHAFLHFVHFRLPNEKLQAATSAVDVKEEFKLVWAHGGNPAVEKLEEFAKGYAKEVARMKSRSGNITWTATEVGRETSPNDYNPMETIYSIRPKTAGLKVRDKDSWSLEACESAEGFEEGDGGLQEVDLTGRHDYDGRMVGRNDHETLISKTSFLLEMEETM